MNFLAHAYLSRQSVPLIIGNFIGDFVKGAELQNYDEEIRNGIIMHRKIDHFTDNHLVFKRSRQRIADKYRHYTGVIIDVFYDHFLARNWNAYSEIPLEQFTENLYKTISDHKGILPEKAGYMLPFMIDRNWLYNYSYVEGIDKSLKGLSRRTPYQSNMDKASEDLIIHYDDFADDFKEFFPQIISYTSQF